MLKNCEPFFQGDLTLLFKDEPWIEWRLGHGHVQYYANHYAFKFQYRATPMHWYISQLMDKHMLLELDQMQHV